jgi:5'-3' exonuclease
VSSLIALLEDTQERVTHVAVAFDRPIRSFRNDLFPAYKTDEGVDPELLAQFEPAEEATRALGLVVWSMNEMEADDAMASAAARWRDATEQVRLLSPDKDLLQCVRGERVVRVDRLRGTIATEASLRATRGLAPASIPDFLALVGDTADGIPGLAGFGEKTATALLGRYGNLEGIPRESAQWEVALRGAPQLAATLQSNWEQALLYRTLATLREDAPLPESLEALAFGGVPRVRFGAWCDQLGADSLRQRPTRWA